MMRLFDGPGAFAAVPAPGMASGPVLMLLPRDGGRDEGRVPAGADPGLAGRVSPVTGAFPDGLPGVENRAGQTSRTAAREHLVALHHRPPGLARWHPPRPVRREHPVTAPGWRPGRGSAVTVPGAASPAGSPLPEEGESRAADQVLARVADARVLMAVSVPARLMLAGAVVVQTVTGAWVRGHVAVSWPLVAACLAVTALGLTLPRLARYPGEPWWVQAAGVHARSLEARVPLACLDIAARHARVTGERTGRDAYLYIPRCGQPGRPHLGACHLAGVLPLHGRLLVVAGEHLAASPPHLVTAMLGREVRHVTGWRLPVTILRVVLTVAGPFLLGWAVPMPVLPAAFAGFLLAMMAVSWVTEISCDLGAARASGPAAMLAALEYLRDVIAAHRAAMPAWKRYAASILTWVTGPPLPLLRVRRALVTALARHCGAGAGRAA